MIETTTTLKILILLMPGFLTLLIKETLDKKKDLNNLDKILTTLLYDLIIFATYFVIYRLLIIFNIHSLIINDISKTDIDISSLSIISIVIIGLISLFWGTAFGLSNVHDFHYGMLRKIKFTNKSSRESLFDDVNNDFRKNCWVIVHLEDGNRIFGFMAGYSHDPEPMSIFLTKAKVLFDDDKSIEIKGPGILITKESKIKYIEYLDPE